MPRILLSGFATLSDSGGYATNICSGGSATISVSGDSVTISDNLAAMLQLWSVGLGRLSYSPHGV